MLTSGAIQQQKATTVAPGRTAAAIVNMKAPGSIIRMNSTVNHTVNN